jgi:hypothetical protein
MLKKMKRRSSEALSLKNYKPQVIQKVVTVEPLDVDEYDDWYFQDTDPYPYDLEEDE